MTEIQFAGILCSLTLVQALAFFILKSILKSAIEFEFRKREQAAIVASLFAEWTSKPSERKELNRLTWEATLWLPDELATEVNKRLANAPEAKEIKEILVSIKSLIHGHKSSMNPADIVHFSSITK